MSKKNSARPESLEQQNEAIEVQEEDNNSNNETESSSTYPKAKKNQSSFSKLGLLSLLISIGLGGYLFYQEQAQKSQLQQINNGLAQKLVKLENKLSDYEKEISGLKQLDANYTQLSQELHTQLSEQTKAQTVLTQKVNDTLSSTEQQIKRFNEELHALSNSDNAWLIAQANYFVDLAARKIWNEQDYATARLLLKNADASLVQANDPSTLQARQAIADDINRLSNLSYVDIDGIIISLMRLSDSINQLPILNAAKQQPALKPDESATKTVSDSVDDWQDNLLASGESFLSSFVKVSKIETSDPYSDCLTQAGNEQSELTKCKILRATLSPEQTSYLRENLKLKLLIAAQAVSRHQNTIYHNALNDIKLWVNANFDTDASVTKDFLDELDTLQKQSVEVNSSDAKLKSLKMLNELMKQR